MSEDPKFQPLPLPGETPPRFMCRVLSFNAHCKAAGRSLRGKAMLRDWVEPNSRDLQGRTPLHHASNADCVNALLRDGSELHAKDNQGMTPAATVDDADALEALFKRGADPNALDAYGFPAWAWVSDLACAMAYASAGADFQIRLPDGRLALDAIEELTRQDPPQDTPDEYLEVSWNNIREQRQAMGFYRRKMAGEV